MSMVSMGVHPCLPCRMESKLLNGRELVENGAKKGNATLPNKGEKAILSNGSWLEKKQVENGLEIKKNLLQDERIEKRGSLSQADWKEDLRKAHVTVKKGPYWSYIGHVHDNKLYIFPEEILHLMEVNALLLKYEELIISIQQAYSILLGKCITLSEYRIYSSLSKEGYRLIRHNDEKFRSHRDFQSNKKNVDNLPTTSKNNSDVHNTISKDAIVHCKVKEREAQKCDNIISENILEENGSSSMTVENLETNCKLKRKKSNDFDESKRKCKKNDTVQMEDNIDIIEIDDSYIFDRSRILDSITNCYNKKLVSVNAPDKTLIPSNIILKKNQYRINVQNVSKSFHDSSVINTVNNSISNSNNRNLLENRAVLPYNYYRYNYQQYQRVVRNGCSNNLFFFNHIFQQINVGSLYFNLHSNQLSSAVCSNSFSNRNIIQSQTHNFNSSQNFLLQSGPKQSTLIPNPYAVAFSRKHKRSNRKIPVTNGTTLDTSTNILDLIECDHTESNNGSNESDNKYATLLFKFKNLLSQCDINSLKTNKKALDSLLPLIKEYNSYFGSNYKLNKNVRNIQREIQNKQSVSRIEIVDDDQMEQSEVSNLNMKRKNNQINDSGENQQCKRIDNISIPVVYSNSNSKTIYGDWFREGSWNKPEIVSSKPKRNNNMLKLTAAFLQHIKKLSNDLTNDIQTWKQAKELYDRRSLQETVSISDDESDSSPEMESDGTLFTDANLRIRVDKVEPLIRPQDCKTATTVLTRLQIIKPYVGKSVEIKDEELKILFDVYLPSQKNFKKSSPTLPAYCIVICNDICNVPLPGKICAIRSKIPKSVKILYAVVSFDSIFFLQMENMELPMMVEEIKY